MWLPSRKAAAKLGLHPNTLRKYADNGTIPTIRNAAGQRLYDVGTYLRENAGAATVCYCRVSSAKQRDDLERQVARMQERFPEAEIIKDVASLIKAREIVVESAWVKRTLISELEGLIKICGENADA